MRELGHPVRWRRYAIGGVSALVLAGWPAAAMAERRVAEQPAGGAAGTTVVLHGAGFLRHRHVTIRAGSRLLGSAKTDRRGSFATAVRIPSNRRGRVILTVRDSRGSTHESFLVSSVPSARATSEVDGQSGARLRWSPSASSSRGVVALAGSGFARHASGAVAWGSGSFAVRTDARGFFSRTLSVPDGGSSALRGKLAIGHEHLLFAVALQSASSSPAPVGAAGPAPTPTVTSQAPPAPVASPRPPAPAPAPTPAPSAADPVIVAAGDIACTSPTPSGSTCHQSGTAALISKIKPAAVLGLGDFQYETGTLSAYAASYDLSWGKFDSITYPTPGNMHDQYGGQDYYTYWSKWRPEVKAAGPYAPYSFDLGAWHIVSVPSGCVQGDTHVDCSAGGPIDTWLRNDLAAHANKCTLAFWHNPRWTTTTSYHADFTETDAYWRDMANGGGDVVLSGDNHNYERYVPQNASGAASAGGTTEFVVGTGGKYLMDFTGSKPANRATGNTADFGVLKMTLHPASYDWQFVAEDGSVKDQGTAACH
jgi:hypothetical protein